MMKISKELTFDAAHMLSNYNGKCNNLHGHTYKVDVDITADELLEDMVLDFNKIKEYFDMFDHAVIVASEDYREEFECELVNLCLRYNKKCITMDTGRPTAENIAKMFACGILYMYRNISKVTIAVWETPTACASYTAEKGETA